MALLLLCCPAGVAAAEPGSPFRVEVTSHSSTLLETTAEVLANDFAMGARARNTSIPGGPLALSGFAPRLTIHRYETSRPVVSLPDGRPMPLFGTPDSHETQNLSQASFTFASSHPKAAAVVAAQRAALTAPPAGLSFSGVAVDPVVAGPAVYENHGSRFNSDEQGYWALRGPYLPLRHEGVQGQTQGSFRFYWSMGTLSVTSGGREWRFESRAWDDPVAPGGAAKLRHIVWYEATSDTAESAFSVPAPGPGLNSVGFARDLSADRVGSVRFESFTHLNGSLPESSQRTGPSLWIGGLLQVQASADEQETQASRESYRVTIHGQATAYALGGGAPVFLQGAVAAAAAGGASLVLLAALASLGKLLLGLYSRIEPAQLADHPIRRMILERLEQAGASTTAQLVRSTGRGESLVRHHLKALLRAGSIKSQGHAWRRRYKLTKAPLVPLKPSDVPVADHVLSCLNGHPVRFIDLARAVQALAPVSKMGVWKAVRRLEAEGRVRRQSAGRQVLVESSKSRN